MLNLLCFFDRCHGFSTMQSHRILTLMKPSSYVVSFVLDVLVLVLPLSFFFFFFLSLFSLKKHGDPDCTKVEID